MAALKQLRRMEAEAVVADGASDALAAITKRAGEMGQAMQQAGQAVEQTDRRVSQSKTAFERTRDSVDKLGAAARQLVREKERINAAFDGGKFTDDSGKLLAGNAALAERNRLLALAEQKYQDIAKRAAAARAAEAAGGSGRSGALSSAAVNDNRALAAANDNLTRSFGGLSTATSAALGSLGPMGAAVQGVGRAATGSVAGLAGLTAAVGGLSVAAIKAVQDQERLIGIFTQATGDIGKAGQEYAFVRAEADRLGLAFGETATQYAKLAAAARGTALEGQDARNIFLGIAEAAAALKMNAEQTGGALTAVEQIISKGKVQAEELRGQLGERLPGAFQIAARAMGVTTQELDAMLQKGAVMADDFLPKFAAELHRTFGGQAASNANGLSAAFNRLETAFSDIKRAVGEGGLAAAVGDVARQLTAVSKEANGAAGALGSSLGSAVRAAGDAARFLYEHAESVKTALVGLAAAKGAVLFTELAGAITAAGGATALLNAAMLANPFAPVAIVVGALAMAVYDLYRRSKEAAAEQAAAAAAQASYQQALRVSGVTLDTHGEILASATDAQKAEAKATLEAALAHDEKTAALKREALANAQLKLADLEAKLPPPMHPGLRDAGAEPLAAPAVDLAVTTTREGIKALGSEISTLDSRIAQTREGLDNFGRAATKTAPAVNAAAVAANKSAQILGTYKETVKGLHPLEDALADRTKKRADIMVALDAGMVSFTQAQKDLAAVDKDYKDTVESITHADRDRKKASDEAEKETERQTQQREKAIDGVEDQIAALKDEAAQLGMTERQRFVHNAALKAEKTLRDGLVDGAVDYVERVKTEAGALYDKTKAQDAAADAQEKAQKASETSAKEQAKIAEKSTDNIVRYAGDTFADLFANTKSGWRDVWSNMAQTARATLARLAAEMFLRPIIAPIVQSVVGGGGSVLGAASGQQAAGQAGGLGSLYNGTTSQLLQNGQTAYSALNGGWGATASNAANWFSTSSMGAGLGLSTSGQVAALAAGGQSATAAGVMGVQGGVTAGTPVLTSAGTGLSSAAGAIGAAAPYGMLGGVAGSYISNNFMGGSKVGGAAVGAVAGTGALAAGTMMTGGYAALMAIPVYGWIAAAVIAAVTAAIGSKAPTVGPNGAGNIFLDASGAKSGPYAADNGMDDSGMKQISDAAATGINAIVSGIGATWKVAGETAFTHFQMFQKDNKWSFSDEAGNNKQEFTSQEAFMNGLIKTAITRLDSEGKIGGVNDDVRTALRNSKATKAEDLANDLSFAANFRSQYDQMHAALDPSNNNIKSFTEAAKELGAQIKTNITDWRTKAIELGLASSADLTEAARKSLTVTMGLAGFVAPLRGLAAVSAQAQINLEAFRPALAELGYTAAEQAAIAAAYKTKMEQDYKDAVGLIQAQGRVVVDQAVSNPGARLSVRQSLLTAGYDLRDAGLADIVASLTELDSAATSGAVTVSAMQGALGRIDKALYDGVVSGEQYGQLITSITNAWTNSQAVVAAQRNGRTAIETAIDPNYRTDADAQLAQAGVIGGALPDLRPAFQSVSDAAVAGTLTANQLRSAYRDLNSQLTAGAITTDAYTAAISILTDAWADSTTAAQNAAQAQQALAAYQADVNSRMHAAVGNTRFSQLFALDSQQAQALAAARANGNDTTQFQQVLLAEREAQSFSLAQQDVIAAYDQQITAQQALVAELQSGAVAVAEVARRFRAANDNLALDQNSPLSPGAKLAEARRQFEAAYDTLKNSAANDNDKDAARQTLLSLGPSLIEIAKANFATSDTTDYARVRAVYAELGDLTAQGVDTADQQLQTAKDALAELQRQRAEAAAVGQRQYGVLTDLKSIMNQSYAIWQSALVPLQRLTGTSSSATLEQMLAGMTTATLPGIMTWAQAQGSGTTQQVLQAADQRLGWQNNPYRYSASADLAGIGDAMSSDAWLSVLRSVGYAGTGDPWEINAWIAANGKKAQYETAMRSWAHDHGIAGFATGGVSYGPQLAMVSEGDYPVEAHVPLPDGRSIPVNMRLDLPPVRAGSQDGGDDWRVLIDALLALLRTLSRDGDSASRQRDAIGNALADRLDTAIGLLDDIEAAQRRRAA
ncbi:tape measure protein [Azospirillum doebereinerae]|uniref:tape measure protein n=1 Tax=Azospirillum doebereinerae TaxID=92933 RepID=UPI001EE52192|nr:tape measure protein [Azospirillum doebereinerae]MCG5239522.1 tape measure protein [Azospirillum doebereinerae]